MTTFRFVAHDRLVSRAVEQALWWIICWDKENYLDNPADDYAEIICGLMKLDNTDWWPTKSPARQLMLSIIEELNRLDIASMQYLDVLENVWVAIPGRCDSRPRAVRNHKDGQN